MTLNIKDPDVYELAAALQRLTGETLTGAVKQAVVERLDRVRRQAQAGETTADLLAIGRRCAQELKHPVIDHASLLYDEKGLPK
jgi:antitoxin VapB